MLVYGSSSAMTVSFSVYSTWLITCDCRKITVQGPCRRKTLLAIGGCVSYHLILKWAVNYMFEYGICGCQDT